MVALVLMLHGATSARADLQAEMNQMFDNLSTTTAPGVFETSRRGVIAAGGAHVRNRIVDDNLASFVPPSFQSGCGGIDLFAGSFSFVSADQFVTLLKAIASNAAGYAFQIALSSLCETCMGAIETMQKKIQQLNQHFGDSCQLAQGIVNDTVGAMGYQAQTEASLINTAQGVADVFGSFTASEGEAPLSRAETAAPDAVAERIRGNIVWRALQRQAVAGRFAFGDTDLLEVMMNLTGTVIVGNDAADPATGAPSPRLSTLEPARILISIIEGGEVEIQGCADGFGANACLELAPRTFTLTGFRQRVEETLSGSTEPPASDGLIQKIAQGRDDFTPDEQQLFGILPSGAEGLIVRLASLSEAAATTFAKQVAPILAVELAAVLVRDL
ncbi:MAG: conjugal transfer protein TraH, partial [Nitrospirota bacterium]|nr:conjugal transfer protein TraH [Nitrospirota bacterium]